MIARPWLLCLTLFLTGCGEPEERAEPRPFATMVVETCKDTLHGAFEIVSEPFEDVGIKRDPIPPRLAALTDDPYAELAAPVCLSIKEELVALNKLLGPEKASMSLMVKEQAYRDQAAELAGKQALGAMHNQVSVLPFRGVVRRLSGAEKQQRKIMQAYEAGKIRRAFLRGLGRANHCPNM